MREQQLHVLDEDPREALKELEDGNPVMLHQDGLPVAALISPADLRLLQQYWEELEDRLDLAAVEQVKIDIAREGTVPYEQVRREMNL